MEKDIGEQALLAQEVQVREDAVCIGGLMKQIDVNGAAAGPGLAVLMHAD
jgi:hypothetical protein